MSCILLVEDHEATRHGICQVLRGWRHVVHSAASVLEAKDLLAQHEIDLLISDIDLPDGTGWELVHLAKSSVACPAIAMSGSFSDDDVRASLKAGFCSHLSKPLRAEPLARAIVQALGPEVQPA